MGRRTQTHTLEKMGGCKSIEHQHAPEYADDRGYRNHRRDRRSLTTRQVLQETQTNIRERQRLDKLGERDLMTAQRAARNHARRVAAFAAGQPMSPQTTWQDVTGHQRRL